MPKRLPHLLKALPALQLCSAEQLKLLAARCEVVKFRAGGDLVRAGDVGPPVYVVCEGVLALWCANDANERVLADFVCAQRMAISTWSLRGTCRLDITALTETLAVKVPLEDFLALFAASPLWAHWLGHALHHSAVRHQAYRACSRRSPLELLLAQLWWQLAKPTANGARRFTGRIAQQALASHFGVTREEVNRKMKMLEKAGYIARERGGLALSPEVAFLLPSTTALSDEEAVYRDWALHAPPSAKSA